MTETLLKTKLFIPPTRPTLVHRPRLIDMLNEGLHRKITLISAPAGFGKTTLVTDWLDNLRLDIKDELPADTRIAWLSLDERDNDATRFLNYLIASLQTIDAKIAKGLFTALQLPQTPPIETSLTRLINEVSTIPSKVIVVLDDYHLVEAKEVHDALNFLLLNLPPQIHFVIVTRGDPPISFARLRSQDQMNELRASDLRFTTSESVEFLNQVMRLDLSDANIAALETRTEGWIAGLQLAAISMQGQDDITSFIKSFTGSHRFILDYLVEEVLEQQPEHIQNFLLQTSILSRLTGALCDALTGQQNGKQTLEYLEQANLFIIPLDNQRRWYRYHHLFSDLLRQRQNQISISSGEVEDVDLAELHLRASTWLEENGLEIDAFQHAAAANDVERATRLMEGGGMPLQFRGAMTPVLNWLESLPATVLNAKPSLLVTHASALTMIGHNINNVEEKLIAAENALKYLEPDENNQDLIGRIAVIRAMSAIPTHQTETIIAEAHRALEYLHPDNLPERSAATWLLGYAYHRRGNHSAARRAFTEAIASSQASGNIMIEIAATTDLGQIQEGENELQLAYETYRRALQLAGDPPQLAACQVYLGLGRISYEWNDLDAAQQYGEQALQLAQQLETVDTAALCKVHLARLKLAQEDFAGAAKLISEAEQFMLQGNFVHHMPEVIAAKILVLLRQGNISKAAELAESHELPLSKARLNLAQSEPSKALTVLEAFHQQLETKNLPGQELKAMIVKSVVLLELGDKDNAEKLLGNALELAEPGGFIRIFIDEGPPMKALLSRIKVENRRMKDYLHTLLAAFSAKDSHPSGDQPIIALLTERELEILHLIGAGLTNKEVADKLFLSTNTVKVHIRNIYGKLGARNRVDVVAKARDLGILNTN